MEEQNNENNASNKKSNSSGFSGVLARLVLFFVRNPYFAMAIGVFLALILVIVILMGLFVWGAAEEGSDDEECQAIEIEITGTISGNNITLDITGENDLEINGITGTVNGDEFTAKKEMTEEELVALQGDNATKIWNYFRTNGYSEAATAGIMGNLKVESGLDPSIKQHGGGPGRGLAQWTVNGSRWNGLLEVANERGTTWDDLETQLVWIDKEINSGSWISDIAGFKKSTSVDSATEIFCNEYERPGVPHMDTRKSYANNYYKQFKGKLYGDVEIRGTIEDNSIDMEGSVGSEDLEASGTIKNGKINASGYLGDTTNCGFLNASVCGFSWPLKNQPKNFSKPACVYRASRGSYHCGDDYSHNVSVGTPVYAILDGKVETAGWNGGFGNAIQINHGNIFNNGKSVYSLYGHLSQVSVSAGQTVKAGQMIGKAGSTGNSTGPHLHLELNYTLGGGDKGSGCSNSVCYGQNLKEGVYTLLQQIERQAKEDC